MNLNKYINKYRIYYQYKAVITDPIQSCTREAMFLVLNRFYAIKNYQYDLLKELIFNDYPEGNHRKSLVVNEDEENPFVNNNRIVEILYDNDFVIFEEYQN
eukprot:CAMPEP_0170533344 /NCGR_PEP_ID=MMETSP0209-20121228/81224_1 /TAXON_ID=665100 ORGANISM="Litonotus pictus, Strain P1" /NCGR_SAMPLE_ID=MMETSP0209 /ASSEMBLY_ACC=CAM_ASM_000301 /LENGTH=100 /DNA_ID=CAMNT_0010830887 /DNA_START=39 /DNA_END=338 /DNA_ORIENTATION=-